MTDVPASRLARHDDPKTSKLAAVDINGVRVTHRELLLRVIVDSGSEGMTQAEAARATGLEASAAWRRISDLLNEGLIEVRRSQGGTEITRRLPSGRWGRVYRVPEPEGPMRLFE